MTSNIGNLAYRRTSQLALIRYLQIPYNMSIHQQILMSFSPFLTVEQTCNSALQWANQRLLEAGLRTLQTFNLQAARAGSHDCGCPHHGTEQCDCQMVILLVYGSSNKPITLLLHGNDGNTRLSLDNTMQPASPLANQVRKILDFPGSTSKLQESTNTF